MARALAHDEPLGHAPDVLLDNERGNRGGERIFRGAQGQAEAGRKFPASSEEIFAGVTRDLLAGGKRGQGIDQAKEVGLERGIAHRPVEHQSLPISRLKETRRFAPEPLVQRATEALDVAFEEDVRRVGQVGRFRGEVHAEERVGGRISEQLMRTTVNKLCDQRVRSCMRE